MYDAAHVSGLTAGGVFQDPLKEGAHVMSSSSYKVFGGPPGGFIVTNDDSISEKLDSIAFPGVTANFNNSRVAALAIAAMDLLAHGEAYANQMLANAKMLGYSLGNWVFK